MERKRSKLVGRAQDSSSAVNGACCDHRKKIGELQKENEALRKQLDEQKDLIEASKMLRKLQRLVEKLTSIEGRGESRATDPGESTHTDLGGVMVSKATITRLGETYKDAPCRFARALMRVMFTDEEMVNKSLFGRQANSHRDMPVKPALDQKRVMAVLECTCQHFMCSESKIKRSLGSMLQKLGHKAGSSSSSSTE